MNSMDSMHHEREELEMEDMMGMGMKMYFHFGLGDQLLFSKLIIDSNLKLWLASAALFGLSIILEAIKHMRGLRCQCELQPFYTKLPFCANQHDHLAGGQQDHGRLCCSGRSGGTHCQLGLFKYRNRSYRMVQALLQAACTTLSFVLMLAAMSYNVCLIAAIVLGMYTGIRCREGGRFGR